MTIIELEQGLRNLIASQPAVLAGNLGDVIRSVLGVTEAYRNYVFKLQSYPVQDIFRFSLLSNISKIESDITGAALAMLNERGINLLLYAPQDQYNMGGFNQFNMGQMAYGVPNNITFGMNNSTSNKPFSNHDYAGLEISRNNVRPKVTTAYSGYEPTGKPTFAEPSVQSEETVQNTPAPSSKTKIIKPEINLTPKSETVEESLPKQETSASSTKPSPAEMLMGEASDNPPSDKAAGRDYLLNLLKK